MLLIEACNDVLNRKSYLLIRQREGTGPVQYDVKSSGDRGTKSGWVMLDLQTANMFKTVHDQLNQENQSKFNTIPFYRLYRVCVKTLQKIKST